MGIDAPMQPLKNNGHFGTHGYFKRFFNSWVFPIGGSSYGMKALKFCTHKQVFAQSSLCLCPCQYLSRVSVSSILDCYSTSSSTSSIANGIHHHRHSHSMPIICILPPLWGVMCGLNENAAQSSKDH